MEVPAVAVDGATHLRRAEDALKAGDALQAAASFAAAGDAAPFESTALGFLDRGEDDDNAPEPDTSDRANHHRHRKPHPRIASIDQVCCRRIWSGS